MKCKSKMSLFLSVVILISSFLVYSVGLSAASDSYISIELDKTSAAVGQIIKATIKVNNVPNFNGYQINIKYDPKVLKAVDPNTGEAFTDDSGLVGGTLIKKSSYAPMAFSANKISEGTLGFSNAYLMLEQYRNSGIAESTGTLGCVGFKVISTSATQVQFQNIASMPTANNGTVLFDWNGNKNTTGYSVIQPPVINAAPPSATPVVSATGTPTQNLGTPKPTSTPTPVTTIKASESSKPAVVPADLGVALYSDKRTYEEQQVITYTLKYKNNFGNSVNNVKIKAEIPQYTSLSDNGNGVITGNTIEWTLNNLEVGKSGEVTYKVKADTLTSSSVEISNTASISSENIIQSGNNSKSILKILIYKLNEGDEYHKAYASGYNDNTFKPNNEITRAEVAAMFARLLNLDVSDKKQVYNDVPANHWAVGYINAASEAGLFKGYNNNIFKPKDLITRAEMATAIFRYLKLSEVISFETHFSDTDAHWARNYIEEVYRLKIVNGYNDKTFLPNAKIKRAEAVTMLNKMSYRGPLTGVPSVFKDVDSKHWAYEQIQEAVKDHRPIRSSGEKEAMN